MKTRPLPPDLEKLAIPALHLVTREEVDSFSKLGGLPNLPEGIDWPSWKGRSLAFLCQIDLAALPQPPVMADLPESGYLYFFYDQEQSTWGFDPADRGSWRVIYSLHPPAPTSRAAPPDLDDEGLFFERGMEFRSIASLPDPQRLTLNAQGEEEDEIAERILEAKDTLFQGRPQHQIGGYPSVVQNDSMEFECQLAANGVYCGDPSGYEDPRVAELAAGVSDWRLLLQLDTDDEIGMMWGDCGLLYFWLREKDLQRLDFQQTWMILQCS